MTRPSKSLRHRDNPSGLTVGQSLQRINTLVEELRALCEGQFEHPEGVFPQNIRESLEVWAAAQRATTSSG
jgi:hypothetical protein